MPPPTDLRSDLDAQRKKEDKAHEAYRKARNDLFAALEAESLSLLDDEPRQQAQLTRGVPGF